ncbi:uncharacterized protein LOC110092494 [Dendrobium catenatum]|uniref:uncharacterized protein LOC110092494 n=1 Tax=Dendrobium catenatum TaxID=906689 RepID=UPI0009F22E34|nr:uncharacterized protein LOC110092494 [Dendrobium catenatum]
MDVCHLILGRPWQFDVGAIYDCRANTYAFDWKGRKLRLLPRTAKNEVSKTSPKTALSIVSEKTLLNMWRESNSLMMLVVQEPNSDNDVVIESPEVQLLLQQFADLCPQELPSELPPIRAIQHQIELIPGATLPNLSHYKMSPSEHQAL